VAGADGLTTAPEVDAMTLVTRLGTLPASAARPTILLLALAGSVALTAGTACVRLQLGAFCTDNADCYSDMCGPENACVVQSTTVDGGACTMAGDCPSGTLCDVQQGACYVPPTTGTGDGGVSGQACTTAADCPAGDYCTVDLVCQPLPAALASRTACSATLPCGASQICVTTDALCASVLNASCTTDGDCPTGTICDVAGARVCYRI
jgi:hypothetical protein